MASRVYSTTFIRANLSPSALFVTYTVPVGYVAVVKTAEVVQALPTVAVYSYITSEATGSGPIPFWARKILANVDPAERTSAHWEGHIAIGAGGKLTAQSLTGSTFAVTVAGYLLTV